MSSSNFEVGHIVGGFMHYFDTSQKIEQAIKILNSPGLEYRNLGANDDSIQIETESVIFDYWYDKSGIQLESSYPFTLSITDFRKLLDAAYLFTLKYENRRIPGLIPRSLFSEWSIAPNYQINREYLDIQISHCKTLLDEIGFDDDIDDALAKMRYNPQLIEDLKQHLDYTEGNSIKVQALNLALRDAFKSKEYFGSIYRQMSSIIVDLKLSEFNLQNNNKQAIIDHISYPNISIEQLDNYLKLYYSKITDKDLVSSLISSLGLIKYERDLLNVFKKHPNLIIELEELIPQHKEELATKYLREILLEKIQSTQPNENLSGFLRGRIINHLIEKYNLPNEEYKSSDKLRQWSFANEWNLTSIESYVKENMI